MKKIIAISTGAFILAIAFSCCFSNVYAQTSPVRNSTMGDRIQRGKVSNGASQNESTVETKQSTSETPRKSTRSRPRVSSVKMADFYLRDGKLVFGKLVSEDKNKITIERLDESKIVVSTYSKREVDTRTLQTKSVPESKYYLDLAEYFSARTWDFRDDPDDFIQAIRCLESAKQSVVKTDGSDVEKIDEINKKMEQLQADRQVWIREVESRAKLKKLEFESMIETRIKELEDKVNASSQQVDKSMARLDKIIGEMKDDYQKLERSVSGLSRQWEALEYRIETRRLLDRWWRGYPVQPYPYRWYYRREEER